MPIIATIEELMRGKSFGRVALNYLLMKELAACHGRWLDIGGGVAPSYLKYIPQDCERLNTDIKTGAGVEFLDADKAFPFADAEFDGVLALNMLYIVSDTSFTLGEIKRVMKPGASVVVTFPFFFSENPEPHDYRRWTREGAEKALDDAGFRDIIVSPVGGDGTSFAMTLMPGRGSRIVRLMAAPIIMLWDKVTNKHKKQTPCFWLARARK